MPQQGREVTTAVSAALLRAVATSPERKGIPRFSLSREGRGGRLFPDPAQPGALWTPACS
ncbi:MAG: hypothetical protein Kow00114_00660 [Kiloniellaceae bacterium]